MFNGDRVHDSASFPPSGPSVCRRVFRTPSSGVPRGKEQSMNDRRRGHRGRFGGAIITARIGPMILVEAVGPGERGPVQVEIDSLSRMVDAEGVPGKGEELVA